MRTIPDAAVDTASACAQEPVGLWMVVDQQDGVDPLADGGVDRLVACP
jgi:hypothetical protein